ncbi:metal ABC transporter substrate-binding protein [Chloroflexota bacterium]
MIPKTTIILVWCFTVIIMLVACSSSITSTSEEIHPPDKEIELAGKLKVLATTSIVSNVVSLVGGEEIVTTTLLPLGSDPHGFEPTPKDITKILDADVIFANGVGLEEFLDNLIESAGAQNKVVYVSQGIELRQLESQPTQEGTTDIDYDDQVGGDPHNWVDPNNVMVWVHNIKDTLSELDPQNAEYYQANSEKFEGSLKELDTWIREQVANVPEANRKIVSDHNLLGYFADQYGFEQVGAVIPSFSTLAEPSASELAELEDAVKELGVKAIFVGKTVNPNLTTRVAEDTGTNLVIIYSGSLTEPDGEAGSYIDYMRYNVQAIVEALK